MRHSGRGRPVHASRVEQGPRPQLWLNVALAVGLLVVAWILFVAGLLAGFDETTGEVRSSSRWAVWSLAGAAFVGSGVAPAYVSGKREFLLVPALTVAALVIGWMGAFLT
jgi:hypothetical protein